MASLLHRVSGLFRRASSLLRPVAVVASYYYIIGLATGIATKIYSMKKQKKFVKNVKNNEKLDRAFHGYGNDISATMGCLWPLAYYEYVIKNVDFHETTTFIAEIDDRFLVKRKGADGFVEPSDLVLYLESMKLDGEDVIYLDDGKDPLIEIFTLSHPLYKDYFEEDNELDPQRAKQKNKRKKLCDIF
jgi:hypothetical protein